MKPMLVKSHGIKKKARTTQYEGESQSTFNQRQLRGRKKLRLPIRYEVDIVELNSPNSFQDAVNSPEVENWNKAVDEELEAHERRGRLYRGDTT